MNLYDNKKYIEDVEYVAKLDLPWNKMADRSILISGATGLIGSFLVDVIMKKNQEGLNCAVYALGRNEDKAKDRFRYCFNDGNFIFVQHDINAEQQYRMWFRGQSDYSWGLVPSVQRKDGMGKHYEQYITTNFMIHTMRLNPNAPQRYDRASWLTLMQHYGLPTRLLDWSESPLVALYFALSSDKDAKTDAAVWVLNPMELNKKVGYGEYVPPISYDSLSGDLEGAFSNQDNDDNESQGKIIACHGVGCDLRMYVQQSDFTIHSTTERLDQILKLDESCDYFYKIRIPRKIRKKLLVQLDAMGFHESSIYPDMEHIAKEQTTSHFNF